MELAYMVEVGLPAMAAIVAATSHAADLARLADRGRIAEGKAADLLVVAGDPTADIQMVADTANHRLVVKNGTLVPRPSAESPATGEARPLAASAV
jgi:imidazolonepropionase-like amidohydrolase